VHPSSLWTSNLVTIEYLFTAFFRLWEHVRIEVAIWVGNCTLASTSFSSDWIRSKKFSRLMKPIPKRAKSNSYHQTTTANMASYNQHPMKTELTMDVHFHPSNCPTRIVRNAFFFRASDTSSNQNPASWIKSYWVWELSSCSRILSGVQCCWNEDSFSFAFPPRFVKDHMESLLLPFKSIARVQVPRSPCACFFAWARQYCERQKGWFAPIRPRLCKSNFKLYESSEIVLMALYAAEDN